MINGRVRCSTGQEIHELATGDTIYFNSGQAHQMENASTNSAKVLILRRCTYLALITTEV